MFTKPKKIGEANIKVRGYKKVIDWEAVFGACVIFGIIVLILVNL